MTREEFEQLCLGDLVSYQPHESAKTEEGEVRSIGDPFVHVLYKGDRTAKATHYRDLQRIRRTGGHFDNLMKEYGV